MTIPTPQFEGVVVCAIDYLNSHRSDNVGVDRGSLCLSHAVPAGLLSGPRLYPRSDPMNWKFFQRLRRHVKNLARLLFDRQTLLFYAAKTSKNEPFALEMFISHRAKLSAVKDSDGKNLRIEAD